MSTTRTRTFGERVATFALVGLAFIDTFLLVAIARQTRLEAALPRDPGDLRNRLWAPGSVSLVAAFTIFMGLTWIALFVVTRRSAASLAMITAMALAVVAIVLGLATYLGCAEGWRQWAGITGWILFMFTGSAESDSSAGAVCAANFAPGSQLARTAAMLAVFSGAVGAFMLLWRQPFDRLAAGFAGDVDVVVGLNAQSLPLIEALTEECSARPRRERWLANSPRNWNRHDIGALLRLRPRVIVFESDATKEQLDRVRQWGAIVLPDDASDPRVMKPILGRRVWRALGRRHTAVRRFYAVDSNVQVNAEAYRTAETVLKDPGLKARPDSVVPRLSIRLDSARDAREWRTREISIRLAQQPPGVGVSAHAAERTTGVGVGADAAEKGTSAGDGPELDSLVVPYYSDALCTERVMAADIVEQNIRPDADHYPDDGPTQVWVFGEGTTALACAEEFAWQLWARYEVRAQAVLRAAAEVGVAEQKVREGTDVEAVAKAAGDQGIAADARRKATEGFQRCHWRPGLRRLVFLGPGAEARVREWRETRSPYRLPTWAHVVIGAARDFPSLADSTPFPAFDLFEVVAEPCTSADEVEAQLRRMALDEPGQHLCVFAGGTAGEEAVARRLAYLRGPDGSAAAQVFLFDREVEGLALRPGVPVDGQGRLSAASPLGGGNALAVGVHRFGPTLVRRVEGAPTRSSDIATRLAHQQHRCFKSQWDPPHDGTTSTSGLNAEKPRNAAAAPWRDLGPFFRHENISQVWSVLKFFAAGNGWRWDRVGSVQGSDEFGGDAVDMTTDLALLAELEHTRWKDLRERQGWQRVPLKDERDTSKRKHHMLKPWRGSPPDDGLSPEERTYNEGLVLMILARLHAIGVVPVRTRPRGSGNAGSRQGQ